jgi:uncharacterized protein
VEPDAVEMRVLGCLIEKQRTTPDAYPLTLNSLRLACNQSTNRDPVVDYDEREIRAALERLGRRRWTRLASWGNSRVMKYRHLVDETLELSDPQLSLLAVLMLRGEQTAAELRQRSERLHRFEDGEVERTLDALAEREFARQLPRRPGERGQRWRQLLGGELAEPEAAPAPAAPAASTPAPASSAPASASSAPASASSAPAPASAAPAPASSAPGSASAPAPASSTPAPAAEGEAPAAAPAEGAPPPQPEPDPRRGEIDGRLEYLEQAVAALRRELADLREQLGG